MIFNELLKPRELNENEYIKDGLVYCSKCNTPRQCVLENFDNRIVPIACECELKQNALLEAKRKLVEREMYRDFCIGKEYKDYTFENDNGKDKKITSICKRYVENFGEVKNNAQGLLLYGDVGTGKTFSSMCISNALFDLNYGIKVISLTEIIQSAYDFSDWKYNLNYLTSADCIIIDDYGIERDTPFANEKVYEFINECYIKKVCLIVSTNYSLEVINNIKDRRLMKGVNDTLDINHARIASRILERCYPVKVNAVKQRDDNSKINNEIMKKIIG